MRRRSNGEQTLRARVSMLAVAVIAAWLVLLGAGFDIVLINRLDNQIDDTLRIRAQAASATVIERAGRVVGVRESATDGELDSTIWVYDLKRAIDSPDVSPDVLHQADSLARSSLTQSAANYTTVGGRRFYVLPVRVDGARAGTIVTAIDLDPYERTRDIAIFGSLTVIVLLLAGAYPVLRFAMARALRPVAQMTQQAAEWSVNSPAQRFGGEQHFAELSSLGETLDALLDRLAAVLRHERQMSAELSHELRTPLARVAAQVDLMLADARPDQLAELRAIQDSCATMDGIMTTLLTAARAELVGTVGRSELDSVLNALADGGRPAVIVQPSNLTVGVEPEIVTRILTPILENARRYAAREIVLRSYRVANQVAIDVSNDGSRIAPDLAEQIFEPGFRGTPQDDHEGAGLGLPLARRLARAADGDLVLQATASRTTFHLLLPSG